MDLSRRGFVIKTISAGGILSVADKAWSYGPVSQVLNDSADSYVTTETISDIENSLRCSNISKNYVNTATHLQTIKHALDSRIIYVDSIADMLLLDTDSLVENQQVRVKGYHAGTAIGGGVFYWDAFGNDADDGGIVFNINGASGQWKREWSGAVLATWFGALPNATSSDLHSGIDNSPYQLAADEAAYIAGAACVLWPPGRYRFTQPLQRKVPHYGMAPNEYIKSSVVFIVDNASPHTWLTSSGVSSKPQRSHDILNISFTSAQNKIHKLFDANFYRGRIENCTISRFDVGLDVDGVYVRLKNINFSSNKIGIYPRPLRVSAKPSTMFDLEDCVFLGNKKGFVYENRKLGGEGVNDNDLLNMRFKNCGFEQNEVGLEITQRVWYLTTENCWSESNLYYGINIPAAGWNDLNSRWDDKNVMPYGNREYFRAISGTVTTSAKKQLFKRSICASTGTAVLNVASDGTIVGSENFPATTKIMEDNSLLITVAEGPDVIRLPIIKCTPIKRNFHLTYSVAFENTFSSDSVAMKGIVNQFVIRAFEPSNAAEFIIPDWWAIEISWDTINYNK